MNLASTKEQMEGLVGGILIARPCCTYYFGPFESVEEAVLAQPGYIEDLVNEGGTKGMVSD